MHSISSAPLSVPGAVTQGRASSHRSSWLSSRRNQFHPEVRLTELDFFLYLTLVLDSMLGIMENKLLLVMATVFVLVCTSCENKEGSDFESLGLLLFSGGATGSPPVESFDWTERKVSFSEPMNVAVTPTLLGENYDGSTWVTIPTTGTTFQWQDSRTLSIKISWQRFPENAELRFTVSGLQDAGGTPIADKIDTFSTGFAATAYSFPDTAQAACYYFTNGIWNKDATCSAGTYAVNDPMYPLGQDAHYSNKPAARNYSGPVEHGTYAANYTTTDNTSGMVWKTCSEGQSGATCATGSATAMTWYNAINACAYLNSDNAGGGYGGRTNWRLPTIGELQTLPDYSIDFNTSLTGTIDSVAFPGIPQGNYWTATDVLTDHSRAWMSFFNSGGSGTPFPKSFSALYVRCVSSPASTARTFSRAGGTIKDNFTGLIWQACSMGQTSGSYCSGAITSASWINALVYCEGLNLAGRSDWRLPNINELKTLAEQNSTSNLYDPTALYWSSTSVPFNAEQAYGISFQFGHMFNISRNTAYSVRCVTGP